MVGVNCITNEKLQLQSLFLAPRDEAKKVTRIPKGPHELYFFLQSSQFPPFLHFLCRSPVSRFFFPTPGNYAQSAESRESPLEVGKEERKRTVESVAFAETRNSVGWEFSHNQGVNHIIFFMWIKKLKNYKITSLLPRIYSRNFPSAFASYTHE